MTECERLIGDGTLDASFLEEEIRCGYHISKKNKQLWALQIDLIQQIEVICKKHQLSFFLIGGGCIGAIRHKGYIPWDDDIDVGLKREDYNCFVESAQQELSPPYFLQTPITDPSFYRPFVVMRNSNGTCLERGDRKYDCNNGILIHVFPLDGYENNLECKLFAYVSHIKNSIANRYRNSFSEGTLKLKDVAARLMKPFVFPFGLKHYYKAFNRKCTKLSRKYKKKIGVQYTHYDGKDKWTWDSECFESSEMKPFEYINLPIPKGAHQMLTFSYGDYMQFPPEEQRINKHGFEIDPDTPYKIYCHNKYGINYK